MRELKLSPQNRFAMSLEIRNSNNFVKVKGNLNKRNVHLFRKEFATVLEIFNAITVSLEEVVGVDRYGLKAIDQLQHEALAKNKRLSIIGIGNPKLYNHFKRAEKVA
ncbi:MAG: hypothetical protein AAF688_11935 [Bacteroidota bacterium]